MRINPRQRIRGSSDHFLNRRAFLGTVTGTLVGGTAGLNMLGTPALAGEMKRTQKRAILISLGGGASQFETWDPKPGRITGGPFLSIPTSVPGYRVCELMPEMAKRLSRYTAVIRSLEVKNPDHGPAAQRVLRGADKGREDTDRVKYPTLGVMLAHELAQRDSTVPDLVSFWAAGFGAPGVSIHSAPEIPGFLGSRFAPVDIPFQTVRPAQNKLPEFLSEREHKERADLRDLLSKQFSRGREHGAVLTSHNSAHAQVRALMSSDKLFDLSREPQKVRDRYGPTLFGQQALVARRLVEAGVPCVRLDRGWWDSHGENFDIHQELVPELDQVLSALLDDLQERGLLRHTLVITISEMGRSPLINNMRGRDHYPRLSVTLSGCGIKPGVVYGKTDADGYDITEGKVSLQEYFATIFQALGIDHQKEYPTLDGQPIPLTEYKTMPIDEVLANA
jgi:Protein of unknown function (DUF1501)